MSQIEVTIENQGEVLTYFEGLPEELFRRLQAIFQAAAFDVAQLTRENAPVRTGRLRDSVRVEDGSDIGEDEAFGPIQVVASAPYSSFVEYGTSRMNPEPFMQPAVDEIQPRVNEQVQEALEDQGFTRGETAGD